MTDPAPNVRSAAAPAGGSLADLVAEERAPTFRESFPRGTILQALVLAALLVGMNWPQFYRYLFLEWKDNSNWSHGFLIPLFSLYLLYARRHEILAARRRAFPLALPLVLGACGLQYLGYLIQNPFTSQVAMVLLAFALVFYLAGPQMIRVTWLPILFLLFALPIPASKYNEIALPLQAVAAEGADLVLRLFGVTVTTTHSTLTVTSVSGKVHPLTVAEACSGLRLLMAFLALSVAMAYLWERPVWQRVVMVGMGIPIAILCNVLRVSITCAMYVWDVPQLGQKFMHEFTGILMLIPAFGFLWLLGKGLDLFYARGEDEEDGEGAEVESAAATSPGDSA